MWKHKLHVKIQTLLLEIHTGARCGHTHSHIHVFAGKQTLAYKHAFLPNAFHPHFSQTHFFERKFQMRHRFVNQWTLECIFKMPKIRLISEWIWFSLDLIYEPPFSRTFHFSQQCVKSAGWSDICLSWMI